MSQFYLKEGKVEVVPLSLPQLFTAGVECGHTAARVELKHQIGRFCAARTSARAFPRRAGPQGTASTSPASCWRRNAVPLRADQMSEMQVQAGQMQMHAAQLELSVQAARRRIADIENSRLAFCG